MQLSCEKPFLMQRRMLGVLISTSYGNPSPWIVWYRNDRLISNVSTAETGQLSSSITLENLSRKDLHSQLMCTANNNHKSHPVSASVTVDMNCKY
ncbi:hypothetical protein WDU94_013503 [Cyamophila willieti]